jgi:hypothetical protein
MKQQVSCPGVQDAGAKRLRTVAPRISGQMGSNGFRRFEGFRAFKNKFHLTAFSASPEVNI